MYKPECLFCTLAIVNTPLLVVASGGSEAPSVDGGSLTHVIVDVVSLLSLQ